MSKFNVKTSVGTTQNVQRRMDSQTCDRQVTMGFVDFMGDNSVGRSTGSDPTMLQGKSGATDISSFLSRPIRLAKYEVIPGNTMYETLNPWSLWSSNTFVKKKLDNFYNFKGNMKLTFKINGTPFHYGRFMASWRPLANFSDVTEVTHTNNASDAFLEGITSRSQRINVHLDPSGDVGGCLCLPWFWHNNFVRVTDAADWSNLGELTLESLVDLRVATDSTDPISITIFAHVEDVVISGPTFGLAAQGPDEQDEGAAQGYISKPAAAVSQALGLLGGVPVIGPFASAASIGAGAIGGIAKIFGFSKPATMAVAMDMRPLPGGEFAHSSGVDTTTKLTFDPKQAVTVDPRTVGLGGEDEMALKYICSRESYLSYFEWKPSDGADVPLWETGVSPIYTNSSVVGNGRRVAPTAISFASRPFQYWSGTLIYRIEIIASKFHKGRLRITWDPKSSANARQAENFNTNFTQIIDLEKTRNFEFPIEWGVNTPYRRIVPYDDNLGFTNPVTGFYVPQDEDKVNGFLSIMVVNELVAPSTDAGIRINVFIRGGDDFELNAPYDANIQNLSYFPPTTGPGDLEAQGPEDNKAVADVDPFSADVTDELVSSDVQPVDHKSMVFFGEPMITFRSMLKRYNLWGCNTGYQGPLHDDDTLWDIGAIVSDFPAYYGYDPNAIYTAQDQSLAQQVPFNPNHQTLLNYLTPAYVGWRGGLRTKYMPRGIATGGGIFF